MLASVRNVRAALDDFYGSLKRRTERTVQPDRTPADRQAKLKQAVIVSGIPALAAKPPSAPGWVHEIKDDGYTLIAGDGPTDIVLDQADSVPPATVVIFLSRSDSVETARHD